MSDWSNAVRTRIESLNAAHHELEQATSDEFIDRDDERRLRSAISDIETAIENAEDELELIDADWETVKEQSQVILQTIEDIATRFKLAGLITHYDEEDRYIVDVDEPPTFLEDLTNFLNSARWEFLGVIDAASEMLDEQGSNSQRYY